MLYNSNQTTKQIGEWMSEWMNMHEFYPCIYMLKLLEYPDGKLPSITFQVKYSWADELISL